MPVGPGLYTSPLTVILACRTKCKHPECPPYPIWKYSYWPEKSLPGPGKPPSSSHQVTLQLLLWKTQHSLSPLPHYYFLMTIFLSSLTCFSLLLPLCEVWKMDMSVPVPTTPLLFEACHPGGRGSNSCDHGQGGVHCQCEAEGAGGRVGEVGGPEGEEQRRCLGDGCGRRLEYWNNWLGHSWDEATSPVQLLADFAKLLQN